MYDWASIFRNCCLQHSASYEGEKNSPQETVHRLYPLNVYCWGNFTQSKYVWKSNPGQMNLNHCPSLCMTVKKKHWMVFGKWYLRSFSRAII